MYYSAIIKCCCYFILGHLKWLFTRPMTDDEALDVAKHLVYDVTNTNGEFVYGRRKETHQRHTHRSFFKSLVDEDGNIHLDCRLYVQLIYMTCPLYPSFDFTPDLHDDDDDDDDNPVDQSPGWKQKMKKFTHKFIHSFHFNGTANRFFPGATVCYICDKDKEMLNFWQGTHASFCGHFVIMYNNKCISMSDMGITIDSVEFWQQRIVEKRNEEWDTINKPGSIEFLEKVKKLNVPENLAAIPLFNLL